MWYGEMLHFRRYTFPDGTIWEEYLQDDPWSGGPNTFVVLRDGVTKDPLPESLWPQSTIDDV